MKQMIFSVAALFVANVCMAELADKPLTSLAFGSCCQESRPAPIFHSIRRDRPQVFVWMGDNIYGDSEDANVLKEKYAGLAVHPDYRPFSATQGMKVLGTWDDHDYGKNDAGKEYPSKKESQQAFLDFFQVPANSPRRTRAGVYSSIDLGPKGKRTRIILLDARYHRDKVGSNGTVLGEEQWAWFEKQLTQDPADLNIIVSGIQMLPREHRFEKWANFPKERERLLALLGRDGLGLCILLSGDRHLAEISMEKIGEKKKAVYEITSSSLNRPLNAGKKEKNRFRLGQNYSKENYGLLKISWSQKGPQVVAEVRSKKGKTVLKQLIE